MIKYCSIIQLQKHKDYSIKFDGILTLIEMQQSKKKKAYNFFFPKYIRKELCSL